MSADAKHQRPATRGRLRIYLGYAPGGGTTCTLPREGHRRAEHGSDVVVAYAETPGRPHTACLQAGLKVVYPDTVPQRDAGVAALDLGAVLARKPPSNGQAREPVVAAFSGGPEGATLIRRAARIAARCGGDLLAVHAPRPADHPTVAVPRSQGVNPTIEGEQRWNRTPPGLATRGQQRDGAASSQPPVTEGTPGAGAGSQPLPW